MTKIILQNDENKTSCEVEIAENQTIFDALDAQGTTLPHGCLAGSCGSCKIEIHSGHEGLLPPSIIESNTIESLKSVFPEVENIRLACRAKAKAEQATITLSVLKKK